jgi:serine protease Do
MCKIILKKILSSFQFAFVGLIASSHILGASQGQQHHSVYKKDLKRGDVHRGGFSDVVENTIDGVVTISTTQILNGKMGSRNSEEGEIPMPFSGTPFDELFREFFKGFERAPRRVHGLGSGFFIHKDNKFYYLVTNYHVVADAKKIIVYLRDKTEMQAELHAFDERTDIAVLKIGLKSLPASKENTVRILEWGDSEEAKVGDCVVAIGNPYGVGKTATTGIISAKGRDISVPGRGKVVSYVDDFFQHSAPINQGNSGGPLLNANGEVIGINTAIFTPNGGNVGIGFSIPSSLAKNTIEQLIQFKRTKRGWLGIKIQPLNDELRESLGLHETQGAIVIDVTPKSPAQKAGLRIGDVILSYKGASLDDQNRLTRLVGETEVGRAVPIEIWRQGKKILLRCIIGEFEKESKREKSVSSVLQSKNSIEAVDYMGITFSEIVRDAPVWKNKSGIQNGIRVQSISQETIASERLFPGDIIYSVSVENKTFDITTLDDFKEAVTFAKKQQKKNISLWILRNDESQVISLPLYDEFIQNKSDIKQKKDQDNSEERKEVLKKEKKHMAR